MSAVDYEVRDRIAYVTLNRPDALNGIDEDVLVGLAAAAAEVAADETVKALVVAGAGDAFCVGLDIGLLARAFEDHSYFRDVLERYKRVLLALEELPVPVIAAVRGVARAGGFELMLACDIVVVAHDAQIGDHHLGFGVPPGGGSTQRLPRIIGGLRARDIIFTGRWLTGDEAAAMGLATRCVPRPQLSGAVEELAAVFRSRSRSALSAAKAAMVRGAGMPLRDALDVETGEFMRFLAHEPAAAEGLRAYLENREPTWP